MPDSYAHERETLEQNIKDTVGDRFSFWYRRIVTSEKPTSFLNEPQELPTAGIDFVSQGTQFERVSEDTDLWQNMGEIPVHIVRNTGFTMAMSSLGAQKVGGYYGICSTRYDIRMGDHLIDSDNNEFAVVSSVANALRIFRRLGLEYLSAATP